jgi:hypothetical protein
MKRSHAIPGAETLFAQKLSHLLLEFAARRIDKSHYEHLLVPSETTFADELCCQP